MMAVAAAQKNREMFAIKKSYSIEVSPKKNQTIFQFESKEKHKPNRVTRFGIRDYPKVLCASKTSWPGSPDHFCDPAFLSFRKFSLDTKFNSIRSSVGQ